MWEHFEAKLDYMIRRATFAGWEIAPRYIHNYELVFVINGYGNIKIEGKDYDVLKVAHHGSKHSTSDAFLKLCKPEFALISAGEGNSYGHPHEELLRRLADAGCTIYNTQKSGAIMLQTDGNSLTIW